MSHRLGLALAVAAAALLTTSGACSKQHPGAGGDGLSILRRVPANTPYLITNLEPWSREDLKRYLAENRAVLQASVNKMRELEANASPEMRFLAALLEELAASFEAAGFLRLGLNPQAHSVIYGLGVYPAFRVELADAAAVEAFLARAAQESGYTLPRATHGGRTYYRYQPSPKVSVVIALEPRELLVAVVPAALATRFLDLLRGDLPVGPTVDVGSLKKLAAAERFVPQFVGYVDWRRAVANLFDDGLTRDGLTATGVTLPAASCRAEMESLAALSPRWLFGATAFGVRRTTAVMILELAPLIAGELVALRAPVPGVGAPLTSGVMSMGVAGDVGKLIALARRGAAVVGLAPYRCPQLAFLNDAASSLRQELAKPIPPWVAELRGFSVVLDSVGSGLGMPDVRAYGLVAASDPVQLIDLAKRALSQLAGVSIPPDGRPVPIPGGVLPLMSGHVAMKGQLLGVSLGAGSELKLVKHMSTTPSDSMPLLSFAIDGPKLAEVMKTVGSLFGGGNDPSSMDRGRSQVVIDATARGLRVQIERVTEATASPTP